MQSVLWPAWAASQPSALGLSAAMPCRGGSDTLRGEGTDGRRSGTRAGPMASAGNECGITDGRASPRSPGSRLLRVIPRHLPRPWEDGRAAGCGSGGRGAGSAPRGRRRTASASASARTPAGGSAPALTSRAARPMSAVPAGRALFPPSPAAAGRGRSGRPRGERLWRRGAAAG